MKKYVFILLLLCVGKIGKANRIDHLQNETDIQKFIMSVDSNIRQNVERWPIVVLSKQEMLKAVKNAGATFIRVPAPWTKADLNDDGETDLLVYTRSYGILIVMDTGNNGYEVCRLKSFPGRPIIMVEKIGGHTVLLSEHTDAMTKKP